MSLKTKIWVLLWGLPLLTPSFALAQDLDVKEFIFEHLGDSYHWHITKWGQNEISIPLLIIVKSKQSGWHLFSSAHLEHGAYQGLHIASQGDYAGKIVERDLSGAEVRPVLDISLTKNAAALMMSCVVLLIIILPLARWYKRGNMKPPKGFLGAVELLLTDIQEEVIKPCVGHDYRRFSPYLLTAFFFIFINNLMGLIPFFPGGANVTGNIAVTFFLAICTFVAINAFGNNTYWKEIFWPEVPLGLKVPAPIMPVIEFFGIFTKPFALMVRLFANIMAGHSVMLGLFSLIFITVSMGVAVNTGLSAVSILFTCFMTFVELLVAYIQAYVFTLLSALFIGMARTKHEVHAH